MLNKVTHIILLWLFVKSIPHSCFSNWRCPLQPRSWTHWPGGQYLPSLHLGGGRILYKKQVHNKTFLSMILWGANSCNIWGALPPVPTCSYVPGPLSVLPCLRDSLMALLTYMSLLGIVHVIWYVVLMNPLTRIYINLSTSRILNLPT